MMRLGRKFIGLVGVLSMVCACRGKVDGDPQPVSELATIDSSPYPGFKLPGDFLWGMATAPAHVEDNLADIWLEFAGRSDRPVKAWHNVPLAEQRLRFWSDYQTEIDLLKQSGVSLYRLGVDWGRLVPQKPRDLCVGEDTPCYTGVQDLAALAHYKKIINYARSQGMRIMLTLYHHSLPIWLQNERVDRHGKKNLGGWTNPDAVDYFVAFSREVVRELAAEVDMYDIFNEPAVFALFAYGVGNFPPAEGRSFSAVIDLPFFKGRVVKAIDHMIAAHKQVYTLIKDLDRVGREGFGGPAYVGVAHSVAYYRGAGFIEKSAVSYAKQQILYRFIDETLDHLDFIGLNYYGEEFLKIGEPISPNLLYSDSGRAVNPSGLYEIFRDFYQRYNLGRKKNIPYMITENGIADAVDAIRPAYIIEHLAVISQLLAEGVPIKGYIHWTLADNWEWADGYCPKFGLAAVDRSRADLPRLPRPSFKLFADIARSGQVSTEMRAEAWATYRAHVGKSQQFCRSKDGVTALDEAAARPMIEVDFRFKRALAPLPKG